MISNCRDCRYLSDRHCAVNPNYWRAFDKLWAQDRGTNDLISPYMEACPEWEESEELQTKSAEVCLTLRAWKRIAERVEVDLDLEPLIQQAREIIGYTGPQDDGVPF